MPDPLFQVKKAFFDGKPVRSAVDRAARRNMSRFGAYVRRTARSSIRSRKNPSKPGRPPTNQTGTLKRFLYFAYDPARGSVVIGPEATNQVFFDGDGKPVTGTVPQVLDQGGTIRVLEVKQFGDWWRADLRSRRSLDGLPKRMRAIKIEARPFMGPAYEKNEPKLPKLWQDSVR